MQFEELPSEEGREPTPEEIEQMRRATPADAQAVDALILKYCTPRWSKVAMVVGKAMDEFDGGFSHLPFIYMQVRMLELEAAGLLDTQGDVMSMRSSEIRLSKTSA